jgi:DNA-binding NtrC family response regulator
MRHILIVDDEELNFQTLRYIISQHSASGPYQLEWAPSLSAAMEAVKKSPFELILLDVHLPDALGHSGIQQFKDLNPLIEVIVISGSTETKDVVCSLRAGAMGYLTRPLKDADLLMLYVDAAYERRRLKMASLSADREMERQKGNTQLIGSSESISQIREQLSALGRVNSTVLFTGPSGTGKGVCAAYLNEIRREQFKQPKRPFLNLNCAALSESLVESELFGHERGAFTDAKQSQPGFFELADGGDIFLDEIGDAPPSLQAKLLKVLQEKSFYRIGGRAPIQSNFTLICATNRDLKKMVEEGRFREDLFMRIATFTVNLPPLDSHREDIPELVRFLAPRTAERLGIPVPPEFFGNECLEKLQSLSYPGNIRELEAVIERLLVFRRLQNLGTTPVGSTDHTKLGPIGMDEFMSRSFDFITSPEFPGFEPLCRWFEQQIFKEAQRKFATQADMARALKLSKATVSLRLRQIPDSPAADSPAPTA